MDIYLLNSKMEYFALVDQFESFIWSERYSDISDFELVMEPSAKWVMFYPGYYITHSETKVVMRIEEREEKTDSSDRTTLTVKGRGMESILEHKMVLPKTTAERYFSGPPGRVLNRMVNGIVQTGIDGYYEDTLDQYSAADSTRTTQNVEVFVKRQNLYSAVKSFCDVQNIGFKAERRVTPEGLFKVVLKFYEGYEKPYIVIGSEYNNLFNESFYYSIKDFKTHAYIFSKDGKYQKIYTHPKLGGGLRGYLRNVLYVDASDIDIADDATGAEASGILRQRALEELLKHDKVYIYSGEAMEGALNAYAFGRDYYLGDVIRFKDKYGTYRRMRVVEYIWSRSTSDIKEYPSFQALDEEVIP